MANVGIGELNERVALQRKSSSRTSAGGEVPSWTAIATVWGKVRAMSGREREHAMRTEATATHVVTIRRRSGISEVDRIVWQSRALNVRFIRDNGPRTAMVEIECEMGAAT